MIRLQEELQDAGYTGGYSKRTISGLAGRARSSLTRSASIETGPGAQAQMDRSTYEIDFMQEGRRNRKHGSISILKCNGMRQRSEYLRDSEVFASEMRTYAVTF